MLSMMLIKTNRKSFRKFQVFLDAWKGKTKQMQNSRAWAVLIIDMVISGIVLPFIVSGVGFIHSTLLQDMLSLQNVFFLLLKR